MAVVINALDIEEVIKLMVKYKVSHFGTSAGFEIDMVHAPRKQRAANKQKVAQTDQELFEQHVESLDKIPEKDPWDAVTDNELQDFSIRGRV